MMTEPMMALLVLLAQNIAAAVINGANIKTDFALKRSQSDPPMILPAVVAKETYKTPAATFAETVASPLDSNNTAACEMTEIPAKHPRVFTNHILIVCGRKSVNLRKVSKSVTANLFLRRKPRGISMDAL